MEVDSAIAFLGVLLACFSWVFKQLNDITRLLSQSVTHEQCSEKRDKCPCVKDITDIKNELKNRKD